MSPSDLSTCKHAQHHCSLVPGCVSAAGADRSKVSGGGDDGGGGAPSFQPFPVRDSQVCLHTSPPPSNMHPASLDQRHSLPESFAPTVSPGWAWRRWGGCFPSLMAQRVMSHIHRSPLEPEACRWRTFPGLLVVFEDLKGQQPLMELVLADLKE